MVQDLNLSGKVRDFLQGTKKLFINGEFVDSVSGKTFKTYNPATGEVLAKVSEAQSEDVDLAVTAAKETFENGPWATMDAIKRGELMTKLADLIEENKQEIAEIDSLDNG